MGINLKDIPAFWTTIDDPNTLAGIHVSGTRAPVIDAARGKYECLWHAASKTLYLPNPSNTAQWIGIPILVSTGVSAGTYSLATVTVNAQGLVTGISSGSAAGAKFSAVRKTSNQVIDATNELVTWDVEDHDDIGGFALGTSSTKFTAPATGTYAMEFLLQYGASGVFNLRKNNSTDIISFTLSNSMLPYRRIVALTAGDYVELRFNDTPNFYNLYTQSSWWVWQL